MKTMNTLKTITLAAILGAGALAHAGDIWDIRRCEADGTILTTPAATAAAPQTDGTPFYFAVRLTNYRGWDGAARTWSLLPRNGTTDASEIATLKATSPLRLGIYVSGELTYAALDYDVPGRDPIIDTGDGLTTLIFKYTPQAGDFALPIRLAIDNGASQTYAEGIDAGPAGVNAGSGATFFVAGTNIWRLVERVTSSGAYGDETVFARDSDPLTTRPNLTPLKNSRGGTSLLNDDPEKDCGFYVQRIAFADVPASGAWRTVHQGSTETLEGKPRVISPSGQLGEPKTVYVWSTDESIVKLVGDTVSGVSVITGYSGLTALTETVQMATLTIDNGTINYKDFDIEGVSNSGTCALVLSAWPGYNWKTGTGGRIDDFVTVTVAATEPLPPQVQVSCSAGALYAGADWTKPAATLTVRLTQPVAGDVTVDVTPTFTDGAGENWQDYFRLSTDGTFPATAADNSRTVTFAAGTATNKTIYVYALRADAHTALAAAQVQFTPTATGAGASGLDATTPLVPSAAVNVYASDLTITAPDNLSTNLFVYNSKTPVPVAVADTYASVNDRSSGFQIKVVYNATRANSTYLDTDAAWETLEGFYGVGANNLLFRLEEDGSGALTGNLTTDQPQLTYPFVVNHETLIRVYAPTNLNYGTARAADVRIVSSVESKSIVTEHYVYATHTTESSYVEGTEIGLTVTLDEDTNDRSTTLYAYLRPYGATTNDLEKIDASSAFVVGMTAPQGVQVLPTDTTFVLGTVTLKDGTRTSSGYAYSFQVVLATDPNWDGTDESKLVVGYSTPIIALRAKNEEPTVTRLEMNGTPSGGNGSTYGTKLPLGDKKTFKAIVSDAGEYDLVNTNGNENVSAANPEDLFRTRWTVYLDGAQQGEPKEIFGNPETHTFTNEFGMAGTWQIKCEIRDKDMADWGETPYSVLVEVMDQPHVTLNELPTLMENDLRSTNVVVGLDYFDPSCTGTVWVAVKVMSNADEENPGLFKLNTNQAPLWTNQGPDGHPFEVSSAGVHTPTNAAAAYYLVSFDRNVSSRTISLAELDGVDGSFTISAYVAFTTDADEILPTSGKKAEVYYLSASRDVSVLNVFPASASGVSINPSENTVSNAWKSAQTIKWSINSSADVAADFAKGVTISFIGNLANTAATLTTNVTGKASGEFQPIFAEMGAQTITIRIEDPDNGVIERTWYVDLPVAKVLVTAPNGPGGDTAIGLSNTYAKQKGLGEGHIYVDGATFSRASAFNMWWELGSTATKAELYAYGYLTGAIDNGSLNGGRDKWIDAFGNRESEGATAPAVCYQTPDPYRDNYFYGWISANTPGGTDYTIAVDPQIGTNSYKMGRFDLPSEKTPDETGYLQAYIEAVFAREYSRYDNMGDIDFDGIPDYFAFKTYANNAQIATPDGAGGELGARDTLNDDDDYYPAASQIGVATLNRAAGGWASYGEPFDARAEIRGYHEGLNYGMFKFDAKELSDTRRGWVSDLHLSENEKKALLRRIFAERDQLVKKMMKGQALTNTGTNQELTNWYHITNVLAQVYAKGAVAGTGQTMFYYDPTATTNLVEEAQWNDEAKTDPLIDPVTGNQVTNTYWVWTRTYTPLGGTAPADTVVVTNAFVYHENATNEAGAVIYTPNPIDFVSFDELDSQMELGDWLDYTDYNGNMRNQQEATKAYITWTWRHFELAGEWGWTCENRTDPMLEDTDGDGLGDGYEYYLWYDAVVGTDGTNQLKGCRFNLDDIESYEDVIESEDIASIYNPNLHRDWTKQDTDNDGLADKEEFVLGTNPVHWDSDMDGLSDWYELLYGMNPLSGGNNQNGAMNLDGDFMAYAHDGLTEFADYTYVFVATNGVHWMISTNVVDDLVAALALDPETNCVTVAAKGFEVVPYADGFILPTEAVKDVVPADVTLGLDPTKGVVTNTISLYHYQVYNYFGFDPRTGWNSDKQGRVSSRWAPHPDIKAIGMGAEAKGGSAVHTAPFTARHEYLLLKYRYAVGARNRNKDKSDLAAGKTTFGAIISSGTTNPTVIREGATFGDSETAYGKVERHGADTDGDGVPDGWELYVGVNPNIDFKIKGDGQDDLYWVKDSTGALGIGAGKDDATYADGLSFLQEFSGTDSCGAYAAEIAYTGYPACDSVYRNHPSQETSVNKGWFNKFFPTDPRDNDTDGDCILDGKEGDGWTGDFVINRYNGTAGLYYKSAHFFSIYGSPVDDGMRRCFAGGGFNPCSIDTDADGLPDPWERQYSGILFKGLEVAQDEPYGVFTTGVPNELIHDDIRAAIRAYVGNGADAADAGDDYHVLMGMDGTVPDARNSLVIGDSDKDWDGDGLQNWQEYMVQAMRHFRYDDDKTPLLGRDCPLVEFDPLTMERTVTPGKWCAEAVDGTNRFLKVSYAWPYTPLQLKFLRDGLGYKNFADWALTKTNENYLAELGYFADPPRAWDYVALDFDNRYMLPRTNVTSYVISEYPQVISLQKIDGATGAYVWQYGRNNTEWVDTNNEVQVVVTQTSQYGSTTTYTAVIGGNKIKVSPVMTSVTNMVKQLLRREGIVRTVNDVPMYFGADPRQWDTDNDGMDDFYELFHGLNPLLGEVDEDTAGYVIGKDVIAEATGNAVNPWRNAWNGWDNSAPPVYDPLRAPWLMGAAQCDADGDGFRNYEEALLPNVTSPGALHTDPTPLWMTDSTVATFTIPVQAAVVDNNGDPILDEDENGVWKPMTVPVSSTYENPIAMVASPSFTALYYGNELSDYTSHYKEGELSSSIFPFTLSESYLFNCAGYDYIMSFEQNEGYDTDNDGRSDSIEQKLTAEPTSDPLDYSDPARRQSIWFGGPSDPGVATSYMPTQRYSWGLDLFKQFTVEAWVRPENAVSSAEQYILCRATNYGGWDYAHSNAVIRLNFALGIDTNGCAFAELQDSTENSCRVTGRVLTDDTWVHLAATYDGVTFTIYVNGVSGGTLGTSLIPANGIKTIRLDGQTVGGMSARYSVLPCVTMLGGRPAGAAAFDFSQASGGWATFADDFFQGSVDEVRFWDGARPSSEISADYLKRYTIDDAKASRLAHFQGVLANNRRNDNAGNEVLKPELVQHFNFSTLGGATATNYVQQVPAGFAANVLEAVRRPDTSARMDDLVKVGWWARLGATPVGSAVYTSPHVVPWIENTLAHLPPLSGTVADSVYWSESYAGYTSARTHDIEQYSFPNTMNPYGFTVNAYGGVSTIDDQATFIRSKLHLLYNVTNDTSETSSADAGIGSSDTVLSRYLYDVRFGFEGVTDLIPLGSAYAKRLTESWDGKEPEDAWSITTSGGGELDGDPNDTGIPQWAINGGFTTREAYIRALAAGLLPDLTTDADRTSPKYASQVDANKDGLPDWWENLYDLTSGAIGDDDRDGLSNYTEYLLSEVFNIADPDTGNRVRFDPTLAYSVSNFDNDYFFKVGQLYVGEIFTDNDLMEDVWEADMGPSYTSHRLWDADGDKDEDGWSAFAECRYSQFVSDMQAKFVSHMVNAGEVTDYPIPTVAATIRYNGTQRLSEADSTSAMATNTIVPLVVKAYHDTQTQAKGALCDAQWSIYPGQMVARVQSLGIWSPRTVHGTLTPGNIDPNSVQLEFSSFLSNNYYLWAIYDERAITMVGMMNGTYEEYMKYVKEYGSYGWTYYSGSGFRPGRIELLIGNSDWDTFSDGWNISVTSDETTENGYICFLGERVGTINLVTGEYALDLSVFKDCSVGASGTNGTQTTAIDNSLVRISYTAQTPTLQSQKMNVYLGRPDTGALREGANDFVAFYDLDGNGEYDPGEPFGYMPNVDVGWYKPSFELELTDKSPVSARIALWKKADDSGVSIADAWKNNHTGDISDLVTAVVEPEIGEDASFVDYRIARWTVDGHPCVTTVSGFRPRVVASGKLNKADLGVLTEREILKDGALDLDWDSLQTDVVDSDAAILLGIDVTNVTYLVVVGEEGATGFAAQSETNAVTAYANVITRRFDKTQAKAEPCDTEILLQTAQPTFRWTISNESDWAKRHGSSYTAFALRVLDATGAVVYTSGIQRMPAADREGVYSYTPPVYAGCELTVGETYSWQVTVLNAKFHDLASAVWSDASKLYVNTVESSDEVGKIRVAVKYLGPSAVVTNAAAEIVVEAFASPDFTGEPLARAVVANLLSVTNRAAHVENARLIGVPKGTCYVRAYLDTPFDPGVPRALDSWESWGYVCPRDTAANEWTFAPTAIVIGDAQGEGTLFDCYIEDRDTNRNGLPDAWEMEVNYDAVSKTSSLDLSTDHISTNISGIVVNTNLSQSLTVAANGGSFSAGLAAQALAAVNNAGIALLALDVTPDGSYSASLATGAADGSSVVGDDVTITNVTYAGGVLSIGVTLTATAQTATTNDSGGQSSGGRIWLLTKTASSDTTTVSGVVYYKTDLSDATQDWMDTGKRVTITIPKDGTTTAPATIGLGDFLDEQGHPARCFFKIVIP